MAGSLNDVSQCSKTIRIKRRKKIEKYKMKNRCMFYFLLIDFGLRNFVENNRMPRNAPKG